MVKMKKLAEEVKERKKLDDETIVWEGSAADKAVILKY